MFKQRAILLVTASFLLIIALLTSACDSGKLKFNEAPVLEITSYAGIDPSAPVDPNISYQETVLFQQKIFWNAYDPDGVVKGYAYRVLDSLGTPIVTPGNETIDLMGEFTPAELKAVDSKYGWVLHTPASSTDPNQRTIWTSDVFATINFPAKLDSLGQQVYPKSTFQVVAIDNRGKISEIKTKYFRSKSEAPEVFASSSKGVFEKQLDNGTIVPSEIGQGVKLVLTMKDHDPYVGSTPWYFEYQIARYVLNNPTDTTVDTTTATLDWVSGWKSTRGQEKVNEVILTQFSEVPLLSNYMLNNIEYPVRKTITVLRVRAFDLSGLKSRTAVEQEDGSIRYYDYRSYRFFVNGKYFPQTLAYLHKCHALGDNHFVERVDPGVTEVLPFIKTPTGTKIARPFYLHPTQFATNDSILIPTAFKMTALGNTNNNNLKVWLKWGYKGEFTDDDPDDIKKFLPRDSTGTDYQTEIKYFEIQLNGQRYMFGALKDDAYQRSIGNEDPNWLRIPFDHEIAQKINLGNLETNRIHSLKIRTIDLQDKTDPTPAEIQFEVVSPKPIAERSGTLILCDEVKTTPALPVARYYIYKTYKQSIPNHTFIFRTDWKNAINSLPNSMKGLSNYILAPSYIQNFKTIVMYHDFNPSSSDFDLQADALRTYMNLNGNVIISGADNIASTHKRMLSVDENFFSRYFGLTSNPDQVRTLNLTPQYQFKSWMTSANPTSNTYPVIDVETTNNIVALVNSRKGLSTFTVFDNVNESNIIYKSVLKTPNNSDPYAPQDNEEGNALYNSFNNKAIATMKENGTLPGTKGKAYLFGFPLSLMNAMPQNGQSPTQIQTLLQQITQ